MDKIRLMDNGKKYMKNIMHWIEAWCYFFSKSTKMQIRCTSPHSANIICQITSPHISVLQGPTLEECRTGTEDEF
jgi:hypothetical protein